MSAMMSPLIFFIESIESIEAIEAIVGSIQTIYNGRGRGVLIALYIPGKVKFFGKKEKFL